MNLTSKSRYALKIMMDLAESAHPETKGVTHRADIARRQGIPLDYMDQILVRLRDRELIASVRGRSGGYRLARAASTISVHEIFTAVEDAFEPVQCLGASDHALCGAEHVCSSKDAWSQISGAIRQTLSGIILSDIAAHKASVPSHEVPAKAVQECRAPRRRNAAGASVVAAAERSQ